MIALVVLTIAAGAGVYLWTQAAAPNTAPSEQDPNQLRAELAEQLVEFEQAVQSTQASTPQTMTGDALSDEMRRRTTYLRDVTARMREVATWPVMQVDHPAYEASQAAALYRLIGQAEMLRKNAPEAYDALQQSLVIEPGQAEMRALAATLASEMGNTEAAINDYVKAIETDPTRTDWALQAIEMLIRRDAAGDLEQALELAQATARRDDAEHRVHHQLARLYLATGDPEAALDEIEGAIIRAPRDREDYRNTYLVLAAEVYLQLEQPLEARAVLTRLPPEALTDEPAIGLLARSLDLMGYTEGALQEYELAIAHGYGNLARLHEGAARWAVRAGDVERARRHVQWLRDRRPDDAALAELEALVGM